MNRGSQSALCALEQGERPSMRPRFMNRGSVERHGSGATCGAAFNEAPIHESGKCQSAANAVSILQTFNEAPIHESGKCGGIGCE